MMTVLDTFAGIGGFSLGLKRTGGFKTVQFIEIDGYCQRVLAKHWPDVPCHGDITTYEFREGEADVITGGFPCQPFSSASRGRRAGQDDDRYLWPKLFRGIATVRPSWVICENVDEFDGLALEQVVSDLEAHGYQVAPPLVIPACAVGHDHRRDRLWIVGHADRESKSGVSVNAEMAGLPTRDSDAGGMGAAHGLPRRMDRLRALGNAVVPQIPELIGRAILTAEAERLAA